MTLRHTPKPRWILYTLILAVPLALLPLALIARARAVRSAQPRLRFFQGMAVQAKLKPQAAFARYADGRAARPAVPGTVARGHLQTDEHFATGGRLVDGQWQPLDGYPASVKVNPALLHRGRERFDIYCAPCHGLVGDGQGLVHRRAEQLQAPGWVQPSNLHTLDPADGQLIYGEKKYPNGKLFAVITHGIRTMPAYGAQIPAEDRWAIVAYVRALQLSQNARLEDVDPAERRQHLRQQENR